MEKIDLKDKKILYHLDLDSRQSFSQIGRKVGLHKDVVANRVKRLQEKEIITKFRAGINCFKLGITPIKFYFTYQYVIPDIVREIIDYFINSPYTTAVHSCEGQYDLTVISNVKNVSKFYRVWHEVVNKYRNYFADQIFCVHNELIEYKKTFLLDEKTNNENNRISYIGNADDKKVELDDLDYKILDQLVTNSRINTLEIGKRLNSNVNTINTRIKKMKKSGVIHIFTINIDYPKIGYQWYKADIVLKDPSIAQKIIKIVEENPNLVTKIKSVGYVDLELTFALNNANQLHKIIEDITIRFPDSIKNYKYLTNTHTYKYEDVFKIEDMI